MILLNDILFVLSHSCKQEERYNNIINSWGNNINYFFYSDHEDISKNIYKMSDNSDYGSGEEKQVNAIRYMPEKFKNFKWYMFCDNDTFVNKNNLLNLLNTNIDINKLHGLRANSWPNDLNMYYCGGGAGWLMSNYLLNNVFHDIITYNTGYGDVAVGLFAREKNIQIQHHYGFNSYMPSQYGFDDDTIRKQITFHYVKTLEEMKYLNEIIDTSTVS